MLRGEGISGKSDQTEIGLSLLHVRMMIMVVVVAVDVLVVMVMVTSLFGPE